MSKTDYRRALLVAFSAFMVGLIYVAPHIAFILELGDDYHYPFLGMTDERHYAGRIREAYQGNYSLGNPFLLEHKDQPYLTPPVPDVALALLFRAFGLSVEDGMVVSDFVFPILTFLLFYCFLQTLTRSFGISLLGTAFIMLCSVGILGFPHLFISFLGEIGLLPEGRIPNSSYLFSRAVNNQFNVIPFLITMICIYAIYQGKGYFYVILGGICQGIHYYIAPFYWGYVLMGSILLCVYLMWKPDNRRRAYPIIALNVIGIVLSLPYWIHMFELMNTSVLDFMADRQSLRASRSIFLSKREFLTVLCFLLIYRRKDERYFFLASFLCGSLICENQQLVTGKTLSNYHFIYTSGVIAVISMVVLYENLTNRVTGFEIIKGLREERWARPIAWALAIFLLINASYVQASYYLAERRKPLGASEMPRTRWQEYQSLYEPFQWLEQHADSERDVIVASEEVSSLLPIFTDFDVLANRYATIYVFPTTDLIDRWLVRFRIYGVSDEELDSFLDRKVLPYEIPYLAHMFGWKYQGIATLRHKTKQRLAVRYRQLTEERLPELLEQYHVRYILSSPYEDQEYHDPTLDVDLSKFPGDDLFQVAKAYMNYAVAPRDPGEGTELTGAIDLAEHGFLTKVYDRDGFALYEFNP
jgi:hypothetical protein